MIEKKSSIPDNSSDKSKTLFELKNIILNNKIPNALLFTGNNNSFLNKSAINFAKAVNCLNPLDKPFFQIPCTKCRSCKKIIAGMHPDIIRIIPENNLIKISAVRNLFQLILSKPNEAKMRTIIIENTETMNEQAQNAFLKMLEEPPANTFFILITDNISSMLATIISRCRNIRLDPGKSEGLHVPLDQNENDIDWTKRREWLLNEIENLILNNMTLNNPITNNQFSNTRGNQLKELKPLLLAEKLSKEPNLLKGSLSIIRTFLRDLAVIRYNTKKITNIDCFHSLKKISEKISLENNILFFKELYKTERKNLSHPSSIRLNLETLFLRLSSGEA